MKISYILNNHIFLNISKNSKSDAKMQHFKILYSFIGIFIKFYRKNYKKGSVYY